MLYNVEIQKIIGTQGDDAHVTGIDLLNNQTKEVTHMPIDGVFLAVGHDPNSQLFKGKLAINDHGYVKTFDGTHKTSVPGVFAAGEIEDYRYRQAWSSGGRGTEAALDALAFLRSIGFGPSIAQKLAKERSLFKAIEDYELPSIGSYAELLKEAKQTSLPIMMDFWSEDCPSCLALLPVLKLVAKEHENDLKVVKVNAAGEIDTVTDLVHAFDVRRIPTLVIFKEGKAVAQHSGIMTKQELEQFISLLSPRKPLLSS